MSRADKAVRIVRRIARRSSPGVYSLLNSNGDLALLRLAVIEATREGAWSVARAATVMQRLELGERQHVLRRVLDPLLEQGAVYVRALRILAAANQPRPLTGMGWTGLHLVSLGLAKTATPTTYLITPAGRTVHRALRRA